MIRSDFATRTAILAIASGMMATGLLAFFACIALGVVEVRVVERPKVGFAPEPAPHAAAPHAAMDPQPTVKNVSETCPLLPFIDYSGHCFEYNGAAVECWIESEEKGKKTILAKLHVKARDLGGKVNQVNGEHSGTPTTRRPSGHIAWVTVSEGGRKAWRLMQTAIDPATGKAMEWQSSTTEPDARVIGKTHVGSASSQTMLTRGQDTILVTHIVHVDEKTKRSSRLVCRISE